MPGAMLGACATHMPDALHERTNELTNADLASKTEISGSVRNARDLRRAQSGLGDWESFDWASLPDGKTGPRRHCSAGWLYVVEFSFGVVKVGQTIDPRNRMQRHIKEASRFRGSVNRFWLSHPHREWMSNEGALLLWCAENGRQTFGEYFADLSYDDTVRQAHGLYEQEWTA